MILIEPSDFFQWNRVIFAVFILSLLVYTILKIGLSRLLADMKKKVN